MSEAIIETSELTKTFRDFWGRPKITAVDKLSIEVRPGEIFGFIGPNGSGKTTTMKMLLGLLFPTSGSAKVLGHAPTDVTVKQRIGFLPEESYLYRFLNADETLNFFGRLFGIEPAVRKKRIDELIDLFELGYARHRQIKEYSKGMMRRVSFAQALINDPEVIFLDEPTSGLDPISSAKMKDLILDLKRRGKTVFLCSHLLADVQSICDRLAMIHRGVLRQYGTVKDILVRSDATALTFENLSEEARQKIEALARDEGATLLGTEEKMESLESIFLKTVRENEGSDLNTP